MGPMSRVAQVRIVRGVMAAGLASVPFTIVGSIFLVISVIPQSFPALQGFWDATFNRIEALYMTTNTATMGVLSLYFGLVFGYEYTKIQAQEEKVHVIPLNGALMSMMTFFMCLPELVFKDGTATLINVLTKDQKIIDGWAMSGGVTRLGTTGIFTAIIMSILAVKIYVLCIKNDWSIKMPDTVPAGVANSFSALIPMTIIAIIVIIINGILVGFGTDIFKIISIPFSFVTNLTNTWAGLLVFYFLMHALWLVGIHGAAIVTSFVSPIVLANMEANNHGAHFPLAGQFNNSFVTIGGSGATLGMIIFIAFFARSAQLKTLGKLALVPAIFNINEPILFGMPIVYNPFTAIPFFLAPMASMSVAYFAIKWQWVSPPIAQVAWPTPVGLSAFIGAGGDWRAFLLAIICALVAFLIWLPFVRTYDNRLYREEQTKNTAVVEK